MRVVSEKIRRGQSSLTYSYHRAGLGRGMGSRLSQLLGGVWSVCAATEEQIKFAVVSLNLSLARIAYSSCYSSRATQVAHVN